MFSKYFPMLLLVVILLLVFVTPALAAQETPPADDLITAIVALVAAVAALLSSAIVNFIKQLPYLGDEDKDKLATAITQIVAVGVSLITGYLTALVAQGLGLIDDAGLKATVIAALTPVFTELRYRVAKLAPVSK